MTLTLEGMRWGYAFLNAFGPTTLEEREDVVVQAIEMFLSDINEKNVKGTTYEGKIKQISGYVFVMPGFSGIKYEGIIENDRGKSKLSFLVSEKIREGLN